MSCPSITLPPFFSREINDEYGYIVGKILFLSAKQQSKPEEFLIESPSGEFLSYPAFLVKTKDDCLVLKSPLKYEAEKLTEAIPFVKKKNGFLKEISGSRTSPSDTIAQVEKDFREELERLMIEAQSVLREIESELDKHVQRIKELNAVSLHLQLEHAINRIATHSFFEARDSIEKGLRRLESMKADLESIHSGLQSVISGETKTSQEIDFQSELLLPKQKDAELVVRIEDVGDTDLGNQFSGG